MIQINDTSFKAYKATADARFVEAQKQVAKRYNQALMVARKAAELLRSKYAAGRIRVLGSVACQELFHLESDVDLAVWGLPESIYFKAVADLLDLDPQISVDLVRIEDASDNLLQHILTKGVEL